MNQKSNQQKLDRTDTLYGLIKQSSKRAAQEQHAKGSFPPTRGGVYDTTETPVRNTARWLACLLHSYEYSGSTQIGEAAKKAADYLCTIEARPYNATFRVREEGKDQCDGLIGQAEPIKSLFNAGLLLNTDEHIHKAIEVFELIPFNFEIGLWESVEITGKKLSFDRTLNHQLIFAAYTAKMSDMCASVKKEIITFLDMLGENMETHPNGLVEHYVQPPLSNSITVLGNNPRHWRLLWNELAARYLRLNNNHRNKERGYQPTVLFSLAILNQEFPDHSIWEHSCLQSALAFSKTKPYQNQIKTRKSKYGSRLPGLHHAKVLHTFEDASPEELRPWVQLDIDRTYDPETGLLTRNAVDPVFQASSISAATELPDMEIQVPDERNSESY
jgi:hypothetical protein